MNTDVVVGVSDRSSDALNLLFNDSSVGREYLTRRQKIAPAFVKSLENLGLSSIANIVAAIKIAKRLELGASDAIITGRDRRRRALRQRARELSRTRIFRRASTKCTPERSSGSTSRASPTIT